MYIQRFVHAIVTASLTISSCALLNGSTVKGISQIHRGQTPSEVSAIMKREPNFRRFAEDGLEQWEYHRNPDAEGNYDVVLIGFRNGHVVSMDSFRYMAPPVLKTMPNT